MNPGGKIYDLTLENGILYLDIRFAAAGSIPELTDFTAYEANFADSAELASGKTDDMLSKALLS